jgi:hypothetical protein
VDVGVSRLNTLTIYTRERERESQTVNLPAKSEACVASRRVSGPYKEKRGYTDIKEEGIGSREVREKERESKRKGIKMYRIILYTGLVSEGKLFNG